MDKPKRILVVDDDPIVLRIFEKLLGSLGFRYELASGGAEALEKLDGDIDLVLLDAIMPEMDGFELTRGIRNHPDYGHVPIIMVTSLEGKQDRLRAVEAGTNDFVTKPIDPVELRVRLSSLLKMKEAQDALRESEARHRMLVEHSPLGIVCCDVAGNILIINRAAASMLKVSPQALSETGNIFSLTSMIESGVSQVVRECLASDNPAVDELPLRNRKDSCVRHYTVPIQDTNGRTTGVQVVLEDVSHYRRAQELRLRSERLKALVEMAEGAGRHFKYAWQAVSDGVQRAISGLEAQDYTGTKGYLDGVRLRIDQAAQTVRLLERFAQARSSSVASKWKMFGVNDAVTEALKRSAESWQIRREREGQTVVLETDLANDCFMEGEEEEIVQLMVNLIRNAAEALPNGGKIKLRTFTSPGKVVFEITDNGTGIRGRDVEKATRPFWTTKESHAGLGLPVAYSIARRHRGILSIITKFGRGTTIAASFPRAVRSERLLPPGVSILLIEEGDDNVGVLAEELKEAAKTIVKAKSLAEGLKAMEGKQFDAVVFPLTNDSAKSQDLTNDIQRICEKRGVLRPPLIGLMDMDLTQGGIERFATIGIDRVMTTPVKSRHLFEVVDHERRRRELQVAFSGTIGRIDILEIFQLMALSHEKLVLEVLSTDGIRAQLFLNNGEVRHATCGEYEGEAAFYECMSFKGGSFVSLPWQEPVRVTMNKSSDFLMMEAARKRDERADVSTE